MKNKKIATFIPLGLLIGIPAGIFSSKHMNPSSRLILIVAILLISAIAIAISKKNLPTNQKTPLATPKD